MNKVGKRCSNNSVIRPFPLALTPLSPLSVQAWSELLHFMDILSARDTYRLALKGSLTVSPLVLTDYRFCFNVLHRLRISVEGDSASGYFIKSQSILQWIFHQMLSLVHHRNFNLLPFFYQFFLFSVRSCFTFIYSDKLLLIGNAHYKQSSTEALCIHKRKEKLTALLLQEESDFQQVRLGFLHEQSQPLEVPMQYWHATYINAIHIK